MTAKSELESTLAPIEDHFTTGEYFREVYEAKKNFLDRAGMVYEDDPEFEQRMNLFLDWYLFDRNLPGVDLPPIKYYFRTQKEKMNDGQIQIHQELCATIHSIFRLEGKKFFKNDLIVRDLFTEKKYTVADEFAHHGFSRGEVFEGRLIPFRGKYHISKGLCFHPHETRRFISEEIKKVKYQERSKQLGLIQKLASMKLKHSRFSHIDVQHIYCNDSRF